MKFNLKGILFLLIATLSQSLSAQTSALPMWPRRFAPAVVEGHIIGHPVGEEAWPSFVGNADNILGVHFPQEQHDTLGNFTLRYDICYPLVLTLRAPAYMGLLLTPGDTLRIDFERAALLDYQCLTPADVFRLPARISGPTAELQPAVLVAWKMESNALPTDYLYESRNEGYAQWRDYQWGRHLARIASLDTLRLSPAQGEYVRMQSEVDYVEACFQFLYSKHQIWSDCYDWAQENSEYARHLQGQGISLDTLRTIATDTLRLQALAEDMAANLKDPHLPELCFFRSLQGAYVVHNLKLWDWMETNGLADSPLGAWMQQLRLAQELVDVAKAYRPIAEERCDSLPEEMRAAVGSLLGLAGTEAQAQGRGQQRELPEGEPATWLPQIVKRHKGRIVFVDFWATWCGPCLQGIKAMETVKDSLTAEGIDFVYITDSSSDTGQWLDHVARNAGDHYIVPRRALDQMDIPAYGNGIPHYLIYRTDGTLFKAWSGWDNLDSTLKLIRQAQQE